MRRSALAAAIVFAFSIALAAPAAAQNDRSYSASTGLDTNNCTLASPCLTLNGAIGKTNANGEIVCLTPVGISNDVSITKSITINCENNGPATNGFAVFSGLLSVTTAASDRVVLRGLDFDFGIGSTSSSTVTFSGAGTLILDHSKITGGKTATSNAIFFQPNGAGKLVITDSIITGAGNGSAGAGIRIAPQPGGTAQVTIKNSNISGNTFGVAVDGSNSTGGINTTIVDSVMASNVNDGVVATTSSGGAPVGVLVTNSQSINNGFGIRSIGNATVRVEGSKIVGNGVGVLALSGGALLSPGTNTVEANATNGVFTGGYAFK